MFQTTNQLYLDGFSNQPIGENHPVNVLDLGQMWAIHAGKTCQTNTNALETSAM